MKKCTECEIEKEINEFGRDKTRKDGLKYKCKICESSYNKKLYPRYKEKISLNSKKYYLNNKEKSKNNSNKYRKNNHNKILSYQREYRNNNIEKIREYDNNWKKNKRKNNLQYKIIHNLRERIRKALKNNFKNSKYELLIGCSIEEYKLYLESLFLPEFTWENYGQIWEIDHIKQLCTFNLINKEEQLIAFNYKNTRPLTISENRSRRKK